MSKTTMNARFFSFSWALCLFAGCSSGRDFQADKAEAWEIRRDAWVSKIRASPTGSERELVRLINFSTSVHVDGYENKTQGQILAEVKKLTGAGWEEGLIKATRNGAESSLVLIEAYESGQGFSSEGEGVILKRFSEDGLVDRSITLDLSN